MKYTTLFTSSIILALLFFTACENAPVSTIKPPNWQNRAATLPQDSLLTQGMTYLSIYSQIYGFTEHRIQDLTVTVSMRNTNRTDTIYIRHAEYYDTKGNLLRNYFDEPIYIAPMETVEIIIDETDRTGGTGANFLFDWTTPKGVEEPFFEAVMISMAGSQGLSFVTEGRRIE